MTTLRTITANKEWLSLEDATNELSLVLNEQVTLKDIWQLAIERKLTLSVYFDEPKYGKESELIPIYNDKALLELAEEFDLYESDNIKNKLLSHLIAPDRKKTLPYKGEEIDLSTYIKKIVHAVKARVLAFSLENEQQKNDIRKRLISLSGFEPPLVLDAVMFDGLLLNTKDKVTPLLSGVWDVLPTQYFLESLKAYLRPPKGFRATGYEPFLYVKKNKTIFKLVKSEALLPVSKSHNQALLNSLNKNITWQAVPNFHKHAELVVRPKSLELFLNQPNSPSIKNQTTPPKPKQSSTTNWTYIRPKKFNDTNIVIFDALEYLNQEGGDMPQSIKELLPIINKQIAPARWEVSGADIEYKDCLYINKKRSAMHSLTRTLKKLVRAV